ncbi:YcaO-like family protein [Mycobacteroides chelonae]|nr:hypothetical protein Chelonae_p1831 [Mycobacterium sp. QIA-37]
MLKTYFQGTHRVRNPHETFAIISPRITEFGITRVANVTNLDVLEIPVYTAIRPLGHTLSVTQGKGIHLIDAKVSATMEAIELWHIENAVPDPAVESVSAAELGVPYRISDIAAPSGGIGTDRMPLNWIVASSVSHDDTTFVPRDAIHMDWRISKGWTPRAVSSSSNGLASGNTRNEACTHALLEIIERDCTSALSKLPVAARSYVDPSTVTDENCQRLIEKLERAGSWFELVVAPSRWPAWCFACYLWLPDMPVLAVGSGAHTDPGIALSRAITEAAQSRLTTIVGTRDDITSAAYRKPGGTTHVAPSRYCKSMVSWRRLLDTHTRHHFDNDATEAAWLEQEITAISGMRPLVVDLAVENDFSVVKILCPGLRFHTRHQIRRPGAA